MRWFTGVGGYVALVETDATDTAVASVHLSVHAGAGRTLVWEGDARGAEVVQGMLQSSTRDHRLQGLDLAVRRQVVSAAPPGGPPPGATAPAPDPTGLAPGPASGVPAVPITRADVSRLLAELLRRDLATVLSPAQSTAYIYGSLRETHRWGGTVRRGGDGGRVWTLTHAAFGYGDPDARARVATNATGREVARAEIVVHLDVIRAHTGREDLPDVASDTVRLTRTGAAAAELRLGRGAVSAPRRPL